MVARTIRDVCHPRHRPVLLRGPRDPHAVDVAIREAGGLVRLEKYGVWFTGRYEVAERVFRDYERSVVRRDGHVERQARGELAQAQRDPGERSARPAPSTAASAASVLSQARRAAAHRALPGARRRARGRGDRERRVRRQRSDLAEAYPLSVLPAAVGVQPEGVQYLVGLYSNLNFQAMGPRNELYEQAFAAAEDASAYVMWQDAPRGAGGGRSRPTPSTATWTTARSASEDAGMLGAGPSCPPASTRRYSG